jgi:hypothetical protein
MFAESTCPLILPTFARLSPLITHCTDCLSAGKIVRDRHTLRVVKGCSSDV